MSDLKLRKLCRSAYAMSPNCEIRWKPNPTNPLEWCIIIVVGEVIVASSHMGPLETSIEEVIKSLSSISERMMRAVKTDDG